MRNNILLAVFFILNFFSIYCFPNKANSVRIIEESRKKRWNACDYQAAIEVAENGFKIANSIAETIKEPWKAMSLGESLFGLSGSLFALQTPTMCDISDKLDDIDIKLENISIKFDDVNIKLDKMSIKLGDILNKLNVKDHKYLIYNY